MATMEPSSYLVSPSGGQDDLEYWVRLHDTDTGLHSSTSERPSRQSDDLSLLMQQSLSGLVKALPEINLALKPGMILEIVGPPQLIKGLKDGSRVLVHAKDGTSLIGTATSATGGRFTDQARFQRFSSLLAPAAIFQALSIATSQYYLATMSRQLADIAEDVRLLIRRHRNTAGGKLDGAQEIVREVVERLAMASADTDEALSRLTAAEALIRAVRHESRRNIEDFAERIAELRGGTGDHATCRRLLHDGRSVMLADAGLYQESVRAGLRWYCAALLLDARRNPAGADVRMEQAETFVAVSNQTENLLADTGQGLCEEIMKGVLPEGWHERVPDFLSRTVEGAGEAAGERARDFADMLEDLRKGTWKPSIQIRSPQGIGLPVPLMTVSNRKMVDDAVKLRERLRIAPTPSPSCLRDRQLVVYRARVEEDDSLVWEVTTQSVQESGK